MREQTFELDAGSGGGGAAVLGPPRGFRSRCVLVAIFLILALGPSCFAQGFGQTTQTKVRLILGAEVVRPGETVLAGVELTMAPEWHTYWRNGGDAGSATEVNWTLPEGVTAGQIQWPVPEKFETAGLYTYGYHDKVVLLVPLSVAPAAPLGLLELKASVEWLECKELCLPGQTDVRASIEVGNASRASSNSGYLTEWQGKLPQTLDGLATGKWGGPGQDDGRPLVLEWAAQATGADFYPFAYENFEVGHETQSEISGSMVRVRTRVTKYDGDWPDKIEGLLIERREGGETVAREAEIVIGAPRSGTTTAEGPGFASPGGTSVVGFLWLAFLGGLILNIMPCVLPVISLKVLGFVNQSRESPARVKVLGLLYGAGVQVSFLVLAALVIGVQQAGKAASWGMQFQNPLFLVCMTVLVTVVALNLFGVFEVTLGGALIGAAGSAARKEGGSGAFANGVLATALATPCTAPGLAPALGFAFSQPPVMVLLFFMTIGLGFALPYLLLSWFPGLLRLLPKPGAWMERFKVAMGFPMLGTAAFLFYLLVGHYGDSGVLWVGLFLVCVALAAWIFGQFVQRGRHRKGLAAILALGFLLGGYVYAMEVQLHWRHPSQTVTGSVAVHGDGISWEPWSAEAVAQARTEGRPILVDFTAKWCVTCNVNKETSIEIESVREKLKEINAVALIGDYTRGDDAITAELRRFGRAGVPLVLVYPRVGAAPPEVLPAVLTPSLVLDALDRAAQ